MENKDTSKIPNVIYVIQNMLDSFVCSKKNNPVFIRNRQMNRLLLRVS